MSFDGSHASQRSRVRLIPSRIFMLMSFRSKIAAVVILILLTITLAICGSIQRKFALYHHRHWLRMHLARLLGRRTSMAFYEKKLTGKKNWERERAEWVQQGDALDGSTGLTEYDKMVSLDV